MLGYLSTLYSRITIQPFSFYAYVNAHVCKMLSFKGGFKMLTDQMAMSHEVFRDLVDRVCLPYRESGILSGEELNALVNFQLRLLDKGGTGIVNLDDWLMSCSKDEPISLADISHLFDKDRKLSIAERVFQPDIYAFK